VGGEGSEGSCGSYRSYGRILVCLVMRLRDVVVFSKSSV
jgi:hypothetical protein